MSRIRLWQEYLKSSFWFIPVLMLTLSICAAFGLLLLDNRLDFSPEGTLRFILSGSAGSARSILSTIAGASIGVAGTVFSITMVVLALANTIMGSRVLGNFMYDRLNQVVLGTYVSTFVYSLIVLNAIKGNDDFRFIPLFSVFAALIGAIASIVVLIIFIHHISVSMQTNKVIAGLAGQMIERLDKLYSKNEKDDLNFEEPDLTDLKRKTPYRLEIKAAGNGYFQSIDTITLIELAARNNFLVQFYRRPGDYLIRNQLIGIIISDHAPGPDIIKKTANSIIQGHSRSIAYDPEYFIHQIVEIAARALSPGINDPFTAIAGIDNLAAILCHLTGITFPSPYQFDESGKLRLVLECTDFEGYMDSAFHKLRQYAEDTPSVSIRMMEALTTIFSFAKTEEQMEAILKHAGLLMRAAERNFQEASDLQDMERCFRKLDLVRLTPD